MATSPFLVLTSLSATHSLKVGEAETSTTEVAETSTRKGNRSIGVAYETERKRTRGHQGNLGLCFPESQLTPPDVHPLDMDNMVHD